MLVLSRKGDQSVVIGGSELFEQLVKITVLEIGGGYVRLGFEARKDVVIHREEVWETMCAHGQRAPPNDRSNRTGSGSTNGKSRALQGTRNVTPRSRNAEVAMMKGRNCREESQVRDPVGQSGIATGESLKT